MKPNEYEVHTGYFDINGNEYSCTLFHLDAFSTRGFWLNENFEYTHFDDKMYWIPPSAIKYVKREIREFKDGT